MKNVDSIRTTITNLIRLSQNNAAPDGEVEAAVRAATRLMAKYRDPLGRRLRSSRESVQGEPTAARKLSWLHAEGRIQKKGNRRSVRYISSLRICGGINHKKTYIK